MDWFHSDNEAPVRLLTNVADWPSRGPGWRRVDGEGDGADCQLLRSGVPRPHVPLVVLASDEVAGDLLDMADDFILADDPAAVAGEVLVRVARPQRPGVRERRDGPGLISALSVEAGRIAEALARLAADAELPAAVIPADAGTVRRLIRLRRDRERYFPAEIFADPAWDMLLDLTAARLEGARVSVSSLCIAAAVPTTTALRWIRSLSEAGMFERHVDESDQRRSWVSLSDQTAAGMMAWLQRFSEAFGRR